MTYNNSALCNWEILKQTERTKSNRVVLITTDIIPALTTILLNVIFIVTLIKTKSLHKPSNVFLGALCVSDILTGTIVQPIFIANNIAITMSNTSNLLQKSSEYSFTIVCGLSFTFLLLVTLDRYFAICHPFQYQRKASCKRHLVITVTVGLCYATISVATLIMRCYHIGRIILSYMLLGFFSILASYFQIYRVAAKKRNAVINLGQIANQEFRKGVSSQKKERNKAYMIGVILGFFVLCFMPYGTLYVILMAWPNQQCKTVEATLIAGLWFQILVLFNSCINPVIYFILSSEFRTAAIHIIWSYKHNEHN